MNIEWTNSGQIFDEFFLEDSDVEQAAVLVDSDNETDALLHI